jgi:Zn-dependent protease with chaperone function
MRRGLATVLTLGLLSGFVLAVVLGAMVALGTVNVVVAAALVVVFNLVMLLVGPTVNDFVYRWLYGMEWLSLADLRERSPASAAVIEDVTDEYGYDAPRLGYIDDRNPNAFTYGSARFNARIVLTEGCFEYLDDEETASVVAHELGHVTSRDFVVMTLANTLVQLLYLLAVYAWRVAATSGGGGGGRRGNAGALLFGVAVLAYVLWFVGQFAVRYLSRVREYAADAFSAERTHPDLLSTALVKIAYGIVDSDDNPELARATRNIGIVDVEDSADEGLIYHDMVAKGASEDLLLQSFLFDLKNPWARVVEVSATHPLTGKRVRALSERPGAERFDFDDILARFEVDTGRLYRQFARDVAVLALPVGLAVGYPLAYLGLAALGEVTLSLFALVGGWLVFVGMAGAARAMYRYPRGDPEETTVRELLADVYASPVRGRPVSLSGELVGRGQAGYRLSEDLLFEDAGGLLYLQYESWLPVLGNLLFATRRVPELVGESVTVQGWFLRGHSPRAALRTLRTDEETIGSYVHVAAMLGSALLAAVGLVVLGAGAVL